MKEEQFNDLDGTIGVKRSRWDQGEVCFFYAGTIISENQCKGRIIMNAFKQFWIHYAGVESGPFLASFSGIPPFPLPLWVFVVASLSHQNAQKRSIFQLFILRQVYGLTFLAFFASPPCKYSQAICVRHGCWDRSDSWIFWTLVPVHALFVDKA